MMLTGRGGSSAPGLWRAIRWLTMGYGFRPAAYRHFRR